MATTINTGGYAKARTPSRSPCNPEPEECPTCGGLECLCRPRFFAGQLLTEETLNQLNQYIIKKNQLHNRYLHGTGVVCGLEVSCEPCDDRRVKVTEGYALSPCGNDIVVCAEDSVDICELIKDCRSKGPRDCRPYAKPDINCQGAEETWLLAICYEESATRGITALRASGSENKCSTNSPRGAPPQCEPTQVCEGYRYRLFKMPEDEKREFRNDRKWGLLGESRSKGPFYDRLMCCLEPLLELVDDSKKMPNDLWVQKCCKIKAELREIIIQHASGNCELLKRLDCIRCEQQFHTNDTGAATDAQFQLFLIGLQLMVDCICNTLIPPCPGPAVDDCVPLAAITVIGSNCRVKKVCNWTEHRKYVITMPTLKYWLSIFTRGKSISGVLEKLCCDTKGLMDLFDPCVVEKISANDEPTIILDEMSEVDKKKMFESIDMQLLLDQKQKKENQEYSELAWRAFSRAPGSLSLDTLLQGFSEDHKGEGQPLLSEVERNNPGEFLMMNMLLQPYVKSFIPDGAFIKTDSNKITDILKEKTSHTDTSKADLAELQTEMKNMKLTMDSQASEIRKLRSKIK